MNGMVPLMWIGAALGAIAFLLFGCSTVPAEAQTAFNSGRCIQYVHPSPEPWTPYVKQGNCTNYAATYHAELPGSEVKTCVVNYRGQVMKHAYVAYKGWALDNRFSAPVEENLVGCIK